MNIVDARLEIKLDNVLTPASAKGKKFKQQDEALNSKWINCIILDLDAYQKLFNAKHYMWLFSLTKDFRIIDPKDRLSIESLF